KTYYLVHWKGYRKDSRTWEPKAHLEHFQDLMENFHALHPKAFQKRLSVLRSLCNPFLLS
ncbi:hypothetical protein BJ508DRAFT_218147, partial [Ascobolus immersus RN42]